MLKILRKNKKWLVVVGGSFLLVIFLVQGAISQYHPDPLAQPAGTMGVDQRVVTHRQLETAGHEFDALRDTLPGMMLQLGVESREHWFLLTHAAEAAGLVGSAKSGEQWATDFAPMEANLEMRRGVSTDAKRVEERLAAARGGERRRGGRSGLTPTEFDQMLERMRGVQRLIGAYMSAPRLSDRRAIRQAKRAVDTAVVDAVIVPAESVLGEAPEPTPDEVKAQFEKYKDVPAGTGEFGFGYQLPARVKIEWLTVERSAVEKAIKLDPVEVYRHWQNDRKKFAGEFEAEKAKVEQELRAEKADAVMGTIDRLVKARVRAATRRLAAEGAYKKLPEDWDAQRPKMETLAADAVQAAKQEGLDLALPSVTAMDQAYVPVSELSGLAGIGSSQFQVGTAGGTFQQLIGASKELGKPYEALEVQARIPATNARLEDAAGNVYYVNILDARQASAPESIEDVRAQVVKDCKRKWAYERLAAKLGELEFKAATDGLEAVAGEYGRVPEGGTERKPLEVKRLLTVSRFGVDPKAPELDTPAVRDAVMERVEALDPKFTASPENAVLRTIGAALPAKLSVAVLRIEGQEQMHAELAYRLTGRILGELRQQEVRDAVSEPGSPFSYKSLEERYAFKLKKGQGDSRN